MNSRPRNIAIGCLFALLTLLAAQDTATSQNASSQSASGEPTFQAPFQDRNVSPAAYQQPAPAQALPTLPRPSAQEASPNDLPPLPKLDSLPNAAGQVFRQYDLRPYTHQISTTNNPQQAIVDAVVRETGQDLWFNEPFGFFSASREQLIVYHTPEIQAVVDRIVRRFVDSGGRAQVISIRLMTVGSPNWRSPAYPMMQPIEAQSPGVEGWMISKENAAILLNQLRRRADFSEHGGGDITAHDGQKTLLTRTRPVDFVQSLRWIPGQVPPYQTLSKRINEGYSFEFSFLTGQDQSIDAVLRCEVDQVERLQSIDVDVPDMSGRTQALQLQIPQMVSWRLHERFRWPADQVLLLSCGVVASPTEGAGAGLNLSQLLNRSRARSDAIVMIEYKGYARQNTAPRQASNSALQGLEDLRR